MCGRYSLALVSMKKTNPGMRSLMTLKRPSQVRELLELEEMPVDEAPPDDGDDTPRESYNFAPGYIGLVYRADTPSWGAGPRTAKKGDENPEQEQINESIRMETAQKPVHHKLQSMKWGLVPHWTKVSLNTLVS